MFIRCQTVHSGFTLAEVLITLGIIGVVAAMTMPSLIAKHQKQVTVTKLKKAVSTLQQAVTRSQAEYGDMSEWTFLQPGSDLSQNADAVRAEREAFIQDYIIKYMHVLKDCGMNNVNKCPDYKTTSIDKTSFVLNMSFGRMFITPDGTIYSVMTDNILETDDDGNSIPVSNGRLLFTIDLNGKSGPNIYGRDLFIMEVNSSSKKLAMFGAGVSREKLKNASGWGCNLKTSKRYYCGALIQQDGWQIMDDYLWK